MKAGTMQNDDVLEHVDRSKEYIQGGSSFTAAGTHDEHDHKAQQTQAPLELQGVRLVPLVQCGGSWWQPVPQWLRYSPVYSVISSPIVCRDGIPMSEDVVHTPSVHWTLPYRVRTGLGGDW